MYMGSVRMVTAGWGSPTDPAGTIQVEKKLEPWKGREGQSVEERFWLRTWTSPLTTSPCSLTAPRQFPGCRVTLRGGARRWDPVPRGNGKCRTAFLVCLFRHGLNVDMWSTFFGLCPVNFYHLSQVYLFNQRTLISFVIWLWKRVHTFRVIVLNFPKQI